MNLKRGEVLGDTDIDGRIILKWISYLNVQQSLLKLFL
jgi:hypothetical protein